MADERFGFIDDQRGDVDDAFGGHYVNYTVARGDTLALIASRHKTTVNTLVALNPILRDRERIHAGWVLLVPDRR